MPDPRPGDFVPKITAMGGSSHLADIFAPLAMAAAALGAPKPRKPPDPDPLGGKPEKGPLVPPGVPPGVAVIRPGNVIPNFQQVNFGMPNQGRSFSLSPSQSGFFGAMLPQQQGPPMMGTIPILGTSPGRNPGGGGIQFDDDPNSNPARDQQPPKPPEDRDDEARKRREVLDVERQRRKDAFDAPGGEKERMSEEQKLRDADKVLWEDTRKRIREKKGRGEALTDFERGFDTDEPWRNPKPGTTPLSDPDYKKWSGLLDILRRNQRYVGAKTVIPEAISKLQERIRECNTVSICQGVVAALDEDYTEADPSKKLTDQSVAELKSILDYGDYGVQVDIDSLVTFAAPQNPRTHQPEELQWHDLVTWVDTLILRLTALTGLKNLSADIDGCLTILRATKKSEKSKDAEEAQKCLRNLVAKLRDFKPTPICPSASMYLS